MKIVCDAGVFIRGLLGRIDGIETDRWNDWILKCRYFKDNYPIRIVEQEPEKGYVSTYDIIEEISDQMTENDIYQFTSSGTSVDIAMKVFKIKWGQRAFLTKGLAAMGYDIPASIGSCIASGCRRTVCVTGDGSFAMNMQELEVIKRLDLPVKIFVTDNKGYSMIYSSQNGNFGRLTGCTEENGLTLPDLNALARAFGIKEYRIDSTDQIKSTVKEVLDHKGPAICTFKADITQKILPKQTNYMREDGQMASRLLEDMTPLLDRDELKECLSV